MGDGQRRIPPPVTGEGSGVSRLSILQSQGSKNRDSQERVEVLCSLPWLEQKGENCACHEHAFESCDEWVLADRLLKYTEENIQKQRDLDNKPGADKTLKSGCSMQTKPKSSSDVKAEKEDSKNNDMEISCSQGLNHAVGFIGLINVSKGKKQKAESVVEKESVSTGKLVKIWIPSILRKQLVDDCEYVTKQDKLVKFPRSLNVDEILKQYLESKSQSDDTLQLMLLYNKEHRQFQEAVIDELSLLPIYGAEHLPRLFVKLPDLLSFVNFEEETLTLLQHKLLDFLKFLQKNHSTFFLSSYDSSKVAEGTGWGNDD